MNNVELLEEIRNMSNKEKREISYNKLLDLFENVRGLKKQLLEK